MIPVYPHAWRTGHSEGTDASGLPLFRCILCDCVANERTLRFTDCVPPLSAYPPCTSVTLYDDSMIANVARRHADLTAAQAQLDDTVRLAYQHGNTWQEIGQACGVDASTAARRWRTALNDEAKARRNTARSRRGWATRKGEGRLDS